MPHILGEMFQNKVLCKKTVSKRWFTESSVWNITNLYAALVHNVICLCPSSMSLLHLSYLTHFHFEHFSHPSHIAFGVAYQNIVSILLKLSNKHPSRIRE